MRLRMIAIAFAMALQTACSSVTSTQRLDANEAVGLVYYMPMKALAVSVTETKKVTSGQPEGIETTVAVDETAAYADQRQRYLLTMPPNAIALNKIDVKVSAAGLLSTSSTVDSDGQVNEIAASLAQTIAAFGDGLGDSGGPSAASPTASCTLGVTVTAVIVPGRPDHRSLCGSYRVELTRLVDDGALGQPSKPVSVGRVGGKDDGSEDTGGRGAAPKPATSGNGFFYRQNQPYVLTVTRGTELFHRSIRFLPNESPVHFLPLHKTFIGKNQATVTFADGVPTQYKQDTEGEVIGAARIPFEVVSAFFGAVGSIFTMRKTAVSSQDGYVAAVTALAKRQQQTELCLAAVRRGVQADIAAACP